MPPSMSLAHALAENPLPVTQQKPLPSASWPGALQVSTDVVSSEGTARSQPPAVAVVEAAVHAYVAHETARVEAAVAAAAESLAARMERRVDQRNPNRR